MSATTSDLRDNHRTVELRLRVLLLGDGIDRPGLVRGDEARGRVTAEFRRLRDAHAAAVACEADRAERAEARIAELEEVSLPGADLEHVPPSETPGLLTPAESALVLRVSVTSIYRAVRSGEIRAVRLTDRKRGALRIPTSELQRLLGETDERTIDPVSARLSTARATPAAPSPR